MISLFLNRHCTLSQAREMEVMVLVLEAKRGSPVGAGTRERGYVVNPLC